MTRIAPGIAAPTQPSIGDRVAPRTANAPAATPAGTTAARAGGVATTSGLDRPVPQSPTGAGRPTIDVGALRDDLVKWEGKTSFMYLCTAGYVTAGIGDKLANANEAMALPWQHRATGVAATFAEIRAAFERVASMTAEFRSDNPRAKNPHNADHYANVSDLVLSKAAIQQRALERLTTEFLPGLRKLFPDFDAFPQPAQRALVDMVYSLGVAGLRTKFPKLVEHCRLGEFGRAAGESERKGARDERNDATHALFTEAQRLKTSIHTLAREVRP